MTIRWRRCRSWSRRSCADEVLITYPVETDRLDVYNLFLTPAGVTPRVHKTIESTDLMLQMVAAGRGVAALPRWLVEENMSRVAVAPVRLGREGVPKQIHLGLRSRIANGLPAGVHRAGAREAHLSCGVRTGGAACSSDSATAR